MRLPNSTRAKKNDILSQYRDNLLNFLKRKQDLITTRQPSTKLNSCGSGLSDVSIPMCGILGSVGEAYSGCE